ncbi:unnamed protein product, partial [Brachionus calyciflorus]
DLEAKSSLKRYKNSLQQYQRPFPSINGQNQKRVIDNIPIEKIHGNSQMFQSIKLLNFRKA